MPGTPKSTTHRCHTGLSKATTGKRKQVTQPALFSLVSRAWSEKTGASLLRREGRQNILAHFKGGRANTWANPCDQTSLWLGSISHRCNGRLNNACRQSPPTRMSHAERPTSGICQNNRKTIPGQHDQRLPGFGEHGRVG
jgi:hypothetical protein